FRGQHPLVAGRLADQEPAVFRQADERGQDRVAVFLEDVRLTVLHEGDLAVGRAQVDADDKVHDGLSLLQRAGPTRGGTGCTQPVLKPRTGRSTDPWHPRRALPILRGVRGVPPATILAGTTWPRGRGRSETRGPSTGSRVAPRRAPFRGFGRCRRPPRRPPSAPGRTTDRRRGPPAGR